jgi:hypothetical protein
MARSEARSVAEMTPVVLGLVTIVSGFAAGLFSDLRLFGKVVGLAALVLWIVALGSLLFRLGRDNELPLHVWTATLGAFILTAALLVIALQTGPRLSSRTLISASAASASSAACVKAACPDGRFRLALRFRSLIAPSFI